ncbi:MAG TPA: histidine--tRNA ligase [Verrucomicrobiae bacterium]|nr:histidine--tRNA ligase [Verrucomicrobiae bacterium]
MAAKYQSFPGMDDILPGEVEKWQWVEEKARTFFEARGYREIRTPILEPTELFTRSIGESTDIVHKEMYTFQDRGERSNTMRPEMTASVARSVVQHGLLKTAKSVRLYYMGPMFRAERPQAGRKRQFHQIGAEIVNEGNIEADAELIVSLFQFLRYVGATDVRLKLNDLTAMNGEQGEALRKSLADYFREQSGKLCKDCLYRLEKNVLRVLDCKNAACQPVINAAPWDKLAPFSPEFLAFQKQLEERYKIPAAIDRRLVRGLDYYTGIVFEVTAGGLGSQNAVAGGGRYDGLYEEIGGAKTPCTGFSIGFERLIMTLEQSSPSLSEKIREDFIYFAPFADAASNDAWAINEQVVSAVIECRRHGFRAERGPVLKKLPDHLKKANQIGARYVVILGSKELQDREWGVKDMRQGDQKPVKWERLLNHFLEQKGIKSV